tara:strand:+ start:176 stop:451 length:276 start_codon:yes stop_codon:yes gene_type:complete
MNEVLIVLGIVLLIVLASLYRASVISQKRLQIGIDNGELIYDGLSITFNENLNGGKKSFYKKEYDLYLTVTRNFTGLRVSFPLFRKNSNSK